MSKTQNPAHKLPEEEPVPDVPPPSYHEALNTPLHTGSGYSPAQPQIPPTQPQRPPAPPQRPQSSSRPSSSSSGISYSNNDALPFEYPKRYLCKKCKNTGFRNGRMCLECWRKFYLSTHAYNPNRDLPFKYPKNFLCEKCYNTGIKEKNGKTCKDCYSRFAKRNNYSVAPSGFSGPYMAPQMIHAPPVMSGPPMMQMPGGYAPAPAPIRLQPGDPRLGGVLCGNCRGTGQTWFLLDSDLCSVCGGLGRILNRY